MKIENQVIWVTGASSGIGEALAIELARLNNKVIISARNIEKLQKVQQHVDDRIYCLPLNITNKDDCKKAYRWIDEKFGFLDCAILNAGTCEYVDVEQFDVNLIERVMHTNFNGFVNTLDVSLPLLRQAKKHKRANPYLVGVCSSVVYTALPRSEAYGASKAAMRYFLEAFRADITPEHIDVSIVYPGFVETPLTDRNDFPMPMRISKEKAADYILKGMQKRKFDIHFPKLFTNFLKIYNKIPTSIRNKLNQRMVRHS